MKNTLYIIAITGILSLSGSLRMNAQQIPNTSHLTETFYALNPAATAADNVAVFDGFFRMQWLGFNGAPVTGFAGGQYPFKDYNMSAGGLLFIDQTGPVRKFGVQLNYSFQLNEVLGRYDRLSLGLSGSMQQYSFNPLNESFNDVNDPLLGNAVNSSFFPSIGAGLFYTSSTRAYKDNSFFAGFSLNQALSGNIEIFNANRERVGHFQVLAGGRIYSYDSFIQPSVSANFVAPDIIDILYSLRYEMRNTFWAGAGYASSGTMSVNGGVILDNFNGRDTALRLGVSANYGISNGLSRLGPGFEFYIGYYFKT
jgi:type IX secretion system PorP/SprF family membrane protein